MQANSCTDGSRLRPVRDFRDLPRGASTRRVLRAGGQPDARIGETYTYCARKPSDARVKVKAVFDDRSRLVRVRRA